MYGQYDEEKCLRLQMYVVLDPHKPRSSQRYEVIENYPEISTVIERIQN